MAIDTLEKVPLLYHFTDRRNLPVIQQMGGLYPLAQLDQKNVKVPAPGGNEWSRDADALKGMGNYVHLYFRNTHPMEFVARQDGRTEGRKDNGHNLSANPSLGDAVRRCAFHQ